MKNIYTITTILITLFLTSCSVDEEVIENGTAFGSAVNSTNFDDPIKDTYHFTMGNYHAINFLEQDYKTTDTIKLSLQIPNSYRNNDDRIFNLLESTQSRQFSLDYRLYNTNSSTGDIKVIDLNTNFLKVIDSGIETVNLVYRSSTNSYDLNIGFIIPNTGNYKLDINTSIQNLSSPKNVTVQIPVILNNIVNNTATFNVQ